MNKCRKKRSKDPATMTPGEINRELDRLDRESSKLTDAMIKAGRGDERYSETAKKDDPLACRVVQNSNRRGELHQEIRARYGPGHPYRLPRGFKRRR